MKFLIENSIKDLPGLKTGGSCILPGRFYAHSKTCLSSFLL